MFHSSTERLIGYWRARAADSRPPRRDAIDPADFADLWPQAFMLGRNGAGDYPVRLAGALLTELHRRDLRGRNGLTLFRRPDRWDLQAALETARRRPEPLVARVSILADGAALPMEVLFAPLAAAGSAGGERYLGLYQPLGRIPRLLGRQAVELAIDMLQGAGPGDAAPPRLRLAAVDGRRIA